MPGDFLLLVESVIGRPCVAVDGKWRAGVGSVGPLRRAAKRQHSTGSHFSDSSYSWHEQHQNAVAVAPGSAPRRSTSDFRPAS